VRGVLFREQDNYRRMRCRASVRSQRVRRGVVPLRCARPGQLREHRQRVIDQVTDQALLRGRVVPGWLGLACPRTTLNKA